MQSGRNGLMEVSLLLRAGHLRLAVLQLRSKDCFQAKLTIEISYFWTRKKNKSAAKKNLEKIMKIGFFSVEKD